mmetsp:Transcript_39547/g.60410  ORF Transcript_39547/g.60410 Transcript_39547/m.60410 type:complete len:82 (-) Transcript_39547:48-293(-)
MFWGMFFTGSKQFALFTRERWNAGVQVVTSEAGRLYAAYKLLEIFELEWAVCDPVMFKYWIFHWFNWWLPEMQPFAWLLGE